MQNQSNTSLRVNMVMRTAVLVCLAGLGCQNPDNTSYLGGFRGKLVDAPAAFQQLNVVVRRIQIHRAGSLGDTGWRVVTDEVRTYDILKLRNGLNEILFDASVPAGVYDKISILFGISTLSEGGVTHTVDIPDAIAGGYTIEMPFEVVEGKVYGMTFDFDTFRSVKPGVGTHYLLTPVIRLQPTDLAGTITGGVVPDSAQAIISTMTSLDSVSTLTLGQTGNNSFQLVDLPEGNYAVHVTSLNTAFKDTVVTGVTVVRRQYTSIGAVILRPR